MIRLGSVRLDASLPFIASFKTLNGVVANGGVLVVDVTITSLPGLVLVYVSRVLDVFFLALTFSVLDVVFVVVVVVVVVAFYLSVVVVVVVIVVVVVVLVVVVVVIVRKFWIKAKILD